MKVKLMLVTLAAASLGVSVAVAAPPPGKGKPTTGAGCKPKVTVVLKGTLVAPGVGSLTMNVTSGNRWGRAYDEAAHTILVTSDTKVRRQGKKTLDALVAGDRVLVQARACKVDLLATGAPPVLTAARVVAHPAAA